MSRSLKVSRHYIQKVKSALRRNGFARQKDLAEELEISKATTWNFLNGRPVDYSNFQDFCHRLGLDWQEISDFDVLANDSLSSSLDVEPDEISADVAQEQVEAEVSNYVDRPPIEFNCYKTILQRGSLLRIKAAKGMGKTSLIGRILNWAAKHNYRTVHLSLFLADGAVLKSLDEFLRWFCVVVSRQLKLPPQLDEYWEEGFGSNYTCNIYFEEYLLTQLDCPLVLALDDVDRIFSYPHIAEDFLGLLRAWHEKAKSCPIWKRLRLVIAHSTEVYIQLNIHRSPFNVGVPIELPEFTPEQVQDLARQQGLDGDALGAQGFAPLLEMVGGHPDLVQIAIYYLARQEITFEKLLQTAYTDSGIYGDHLRRHLSNLQEYPELVIAMKKVVDATMPVQLEPMQAFKLQSLGLVRLEGNNVKPLCNLYARYFGDRLS
jgi:hypothetical protein